jgi:hypothetical protein
MENDTLKQAALIMGDESKCNSAKPLQILGISNVYLTSYITELFMGLIQESH